MSLRRRIERLEGQRLGPRAAIVRFTEWLASWRAGDRKAADRHAEAIRNHEDADPSLTAAIDEVSER